MKITNRKFGRDYDSLEEFEVGIVLTGPEVKSIRAGKLKLEDSHVKIIDGAPQLINAEIYPYQFADITKQEPKRSRKLLLTKKEIIRIQTKIHGHSGLTLAPISCYNKGDLIKLKIALVKPRKDIEKKKLDKQKKLVRNEKREAKEFMKY